MTYKHVGFHQSEVMRSLERQAVKKGHFDPKPEELVEAAAYQIKNNNFEPTDNLFNDLMRLAKGLRSKGLENYALDIEKNAVIFKTAETHLYKVWEETGDDVINFAHPDGNVHVFDAQQELGRFETILGIKEKMLEVAHKQPAMHVVQQSAVQTQQQVEIDVEDESSADNAELEVMAALIKGAQAGTESETLRDNNQKKVNDSFSVLQGALRNIRDSLQKSFPQIASQIDGIARSLNVQLGFDSSSYKNAVKVIGDSVVAVKSLIGSARQPSDTAGQIAYQTLGSLVGEYERIARDEMTTIYSLVPGQSGQKMTAANQPANHDKLSQAIQYYNYAYKLWDYALRQYQSTGDENDASIAAKNLEESKDLLNLMMVAVDRNMSLFDLASALKGKITFSNEDGIIEHARKWALDTEKFAKSTGTLKQSSVNEPLKKSLDDVSIIPTGDKPPARPVGIDQPSARPVGIDQPYSAQSGPITVQVPHNQPVQHTGPVRPIKEEFQAVSMMQQLMSELATGLNEQAAVIAPKLHIEVDALQNLAHGIRDTGIGTTGVAQDGKWGPKTIEALNKVNHLVSNTSVRQKLDPGEDYLQLKPEDVIAKAKSNQQILAGMMNEAGLGNYMKTVPPGVVVKNNVLDRVPTELSKETLFEPEDVAGNVPAVPGDFASLNDFYLFLSGLGMNVVRASSKNEITKLAQVNPYAGIAGPKAPEITRMGPGDHKYNDDLTPINNASEGMTVKQFNDALIWFYQRSLHQMDALRDGSNPQDQQRKQSYNNALRKLWQDWRASGLSKQPASAVLSGADFNPGQAGSNNQSKTVSAPGQAQAPVGYQNVSYRQPGALQEGTSVGGAPSADQVALQDPPFTDSTGKRTKIVIDLLDIAKWSPGTAQWYKSYMGNTILDLRKWNGASVDVLVDEYANDGFDEANSNHRGRGAEFGVPEMSQEWMKNQPGQPLPNYVWLYDICNHIKRNLSSAFANWKKSLTFKANDERMANITQSLIEANEYAFSQWLENINGQQIACQRMARQNRPQQDMTRRNAG